MYLKKNIRYLRKRDRLSQIELGSLINKTSEVVSTYERGVTVPSLESTIEMCKIFKVALDDLIFRDIEKEGISDNPIASVDKIDDDALIKINNLLEKRVITLEREIRRNNPDLADELGID